MKHPQQRSSLDAWVEARQGRGLYWFTRHLAETELGMSSAAFRMAARRLEKKTCATRVYRDFYVVVPPEYRAVGSLPADWFITDLMTYLNRPFYVGLLTAAAYHGAAHQRPEKFHVFTGVPMREIQCGAVTVRFFVKRDPARTPQQSITVQTGYIPVSTPEATALDLLRHARSIGGLNHVLTVLQELGEQVDGRKLVDAAKLDGARGMAVAQRLGWLLEKAGYNGQAVELAGWLKDKNPAPAKLYPHAPARGAVLEKRWNLWLNGEVEGDLG